VVSTGGIQDGYVLVIHAATDRLWEVSDLVALLEASEREQSSRLLRTGRAKIVAASENHANRPSGRWRTVSNRWLYLVPARRQRATGKLHDWPDSMGRKRRDLRGGRNHCVGCCREKANAQGLGSVGWGSRNGD
jgi:hypothetical protein